MKRIALIPVFIFAVLAITYGTHNRAGEITLKQIGTFTYEITIQTFTYQRSPADRPALDVQWGDGTVSVAERGNRKISLPNFYWHNTYKAEHTYPGPGIYTVVVQDPNRNFGVQNIPNSVNVIFSITTTIAINPDIGINSTPVLLNPPIDRAALGQIFVHNPSAFDEDGDSISYKLTICTEENGKPIENYSFPRASDTLYIDEISGDLVWDAPVDTGIVNIAIEIEEWRQGVKIGSISRDMQIEVYSTDNHPPVNMPLRDFCVEAGALLEYDIISTDPDNDSVYQSAFGGPLITTSSTDTFYTLVADEGYSVSRFSWQTKCEHVRSQPYDVVIKAEDNNHELRLVDIDNFSIRVIGPPPKNPETFAGSTTITVSWDTCECNNVTGYAVYRKEGSTGYQPDSCDTGVPAYLGYSLIGLTGSRNETFFLDDNGGDMLQQGVSYCYMVVAIYNDGVLGHPSAEACDVLIQGTPVVLQASVTDLDSNGEVFLSWARPRGLDTIPANGPYKYLIYRSDQDAWGNNLQLIDSIFTADLNDTTYLDGPLNTILFPYSYRIELYNEEFGTSDLIGEQEQVSTTWLEVEPTDNANLLKVRKNTPWVNDSMIIYRLDPGGTTYDSVGMSLSSEYLDEGLSNLEEYCYQVKTLGWRNVDSILYTSINLSHTACGTPRDTIPPCPPSLTVESFCDSSYNLLEWTNPNNYCADDVAGYNIYYFNSLAWTLLATVQSAEDTVYRHSPEGGLAACYRVTAVDSNGNETLSPEEVCVDNCIDYNLPNVFTPNGDNLNDYFRPDSYSFVEKVDMKIYSRWGDLVFRTDEPEINWDGKRMNTDRLVSPGVYYYVCDVYEQRLGGSGELPELQLQVRTLVGFVYVITESDSTNPPPE